LEPITFHEFDSEPAEMVCLAVFGGGGGTEPFTASGNCRLI